MHKSLIRLALEGMYHGAGVQVIQNRNVLVRSITLSFFPLVFFFLFGFFYSISVLANALV